MKQIIPQTQEQQQRLVITPQMRQSLAILQMPLAELQAYVAQQLAENCLLELEDERDEDRPPEEADQSRPEETPEPDWAEYFTDGRDLGVAAGERPKPPTGDPAAAPPSLQDHLLAQIRLLSWPEQARRIGEFLAGSLDEDGYLQVTVAECAAALGVAGREVEEVLQSIQALDPPGVGARDLRECLLIQVKLGEDPEGPAAQLAAEIIGACLGDLAAGRYAKIAEKLGVPPSDVRAALDSIKRLDPRPARNFGPAGPGYILPDVSLRYIDGECLIAVREGAAAGLRISPLYRRMLAEMQMADRETLEYLRSRLNAAAALLKSIEQRRATLAKIAEAVIRLQGPFFTEIQAPLRPLTLREVAAEVGLHESTVSRAMAGKYLETPRGTFGFRHFFGAGLAGPDGDAIAAEDVKRILRQTVAGEKPAAPLNDQEIAALLQGLGIKIARRTVAKYREELGIPPAPYRGW